jgi:putative glycosyltransferase (TIGR04348 family)
MGSAAKPVVFIVTPGTREANNGNWRTAARWAQMLRARYRVIVQSEWHGERADAMLALHARRSASSIEEFHQNHAGGLAVVLTGTDLYGDLPESREVARSLEIADRIVVLQEDAMRALPRAPRGKATVIFQSAPPIQRRAKPPDSLECVAVGHLRAEKDPRTLFRAWSRLPADAPIFMRHIGAPLDAALGAEALETSRRDQRYRYSGALPHGLTRAAIARAHVLVHPSIAEGGANVIVEAVMAGTAVIASRISGNVGMLGRDYPGYFDAGDESGLARRLVQAFEDRDYLRKLQSACVKRRPLFAPSREQRAVRALVASLLAEPAAVES